MTKEEIRIVMAEIDGYRIDSSNSQGINWIFPNGDIETEWKEDFETGNIIVPNYPEDLNAIAEFRKRHLTNIRLRTSYVYELKTILRWSIGDTYFELIDATPLQHCEALIKTLAPEK